LRRSFRSERPPSALEPHSPRLGADRPSFVEDRSGFFIVAIYYVCPDHDTPAGGIRGIYRHVDALRRNGFEAFVVHERPGFRCSWFESETPILGWSARGYELEAPVDRPFLQLQGPPSFELSAADVVVVPEIYGPHIAEIAPGIPKVIFNMNVHFTFRYYSHDVKALERQASPYHHPDVVAVVVKSRQGYEYLRFAFPHARVLQVRNSFDPALFYVEEPKEPWIGYMPRRNVEDGLHVLSILALRGTLRDYEIVPIDGLDENGVAALLRRCLVFLSLGTQEGFVRPPAEAMACGAAVVGYHGNGGRELFRAEFTNVVTAGDIREFAQELEKVLRLHTQRPEELRERRRQAAEFVHQNYSPELEEMDLLSAWKEILAIAPPRRRSRLFGRPGRSSRRPVRGR
jgi:glycosyltransferase involved in cell wall biosynthesis